MKLGITYRLFLLILCATGVAIIFLLLIMWWNINQGFYNYLGEVDQRRLAQFIDDLEKNYAKWGGTGIFSGKHLRAGTLAVR